MAENHTPVLIVGGGVVGLSSAIFLAWHGVPSLLVERHPDLLIHPRARGLTARTMELFRQVGLEPALRAAAFAGAGFAYVPVRAETLADETYQNPDEPFEDDGSSASPCGFGPIDQDKLEISLRDWLLERDGTQLRFGTELTSFETGDNGVVAMITDRESGETETIRADYLIAADGAGSPIRQRLGIGADGPGPLFQTLTAIIRADLRPALRGRTASIAYLNRPRPNTILMAHDQEGLRWVFGTGYDPRSESLADYTDDRIVAMVREASGLPDVEVELLPQIPGTTMTVLGFPIGAQVINNYRSGRIFLAGDAAHLVPPTGGLGANTGIQDAHNLAWKLAQVINGIAGPGLLDSYHEERRPTGLLTMQQALARFGARMGPGTEGGVVEYGAVALGYHYRSTAVIGASDDHGPTPPRLLSGAPGTRAPHVPITGSSAGDSTLDLYGRGFVLLAGRDGEAWRRAAADQRVPVAAYRFGVELTATDGTELHDRHGVETGGAVLVRPDGFVAWRCAGAVDDPGRILAGVFADLLGVA